MDVVPLYVSLYNYCSGQLKIVFSQLGLLYPVSNSPYITLDPGYMHLTQGFWLAFGI